LCRCGDGCTVEVVTGCADETANALANGSAEGITLCKGRILALRTPVDHAGKAAGLMANSPCRIEKDGVRAATVRYSDVDDILPLSTRIWRTSWGRAVGAQVGPTAWCGRRGCGRRADRGRLRAQKYDYFLSGKDNRPPLAWHPSGDAARTDLLYGAVACKP